MPTIYVPTVLDVQRSLFPFYLIWVFLKGYDVEGRHYIRLSHQPAEFCKVQMGNFFMATYSKFTKEI